MNDQQKSPNQQQSTDQEQSTYVAREAPDGQILMELWVLYEPARDEWGNPAARLLRVDDPLLGYEGVEDELSGEQRAEIEKDLGLPLLEETGRPEATPDAPEEDGQEEEPPLEWETCPRWWRTSKGDYRRVAYVRHGRRDWIGGVGYVFSDVVSVWNPERGRTLEEAGSSAAPGEQFALVLTAEEFERRTFPPEDLPPVGRETARKALTACPGEEQRVSFVLCACDTIPNATGAGATDTTRRPRASCPSSTSTRRRRGWSTWMACARSAKAHR